MKVSIKYGHPLTNYMDCVSIFVTGDTNQKVVWLDVAIDQGFFVDGLHASNLYDGKNRSAPARQGEGYRLMISTRTRTVAQRGPNTLGAE